MLTFASVVALLPNLLHRCYRKRCTLVTQNAALLLTENAALAVTVNTPDGQRPDAVLHHIVVYLVTAVGDVERQFFKDHIGVGDGLLHQRLRRALEDACLHPRLELLDFRISLSCRRAFLSSWSGLLSAASRASASASTS